MEILLMNPTTLKIGVPVVVAAILGIGGAVISYAGDGLKQETVTSVVNALAPTTEALAKAAEKNAEIAASNQAEVRALQKKHAEQEAYTALLRQLCADGTIANPSEDARCRALPPKKD
jgi:hypothetical protein